MQDIQNSTVLWDVLDGGVMDTALQLHHATMRSVLRKHNGYESGGAGDWKWRRKFGGLLDSVITADADGGTQWAQCPPCFSAVLPCWLMIFAGTEGDSFILAFHDETSAVRALVCVRASDCMPCACRTGPNQPPAAYLQAVPALL